MMSTGPHNLSIHELSAMLDVMREGIQIIGRDFRYVYLNEAAATHGRRPRGDLIGRTMMECYPGIDDTDVFALLRRAFDEGTSGSMLNEFVYPDGLTRTFELRIEPCEVGVVVLSIDVTDSHKLESQLRHAQKMEAIGRLAGSVAHDFNNLLSVILSYSKMLLLDLNPLDPIREDIEAIKTAGEKAADLTMQLLAFGRRQVVTPRILDLNEAVHGAEQMLRRLLGEDIELISIYDRAIAKVKIDPSQLDQVIMNLAINARDAMPSGGKLTIETRNVMLDDSYVADHLDAKVGPHVMLAVSDTGIGMDREIQARIFEPFFTTKEPGKGTGLGLSTTFGIVKQSGGSIFVYSEPGDGAVFKVYLPRISTSDSPARGPSAPATLRGTETILLVEDQDEVRKVAREVLRRYGYHVLEARNAGEALLTCERHPRTIHLLLTDVVMPQMSGPELAERLAQLRPDMKVLFMSGYAEGAAVYHGIVDSGLAYLQKPLEPEGLALRIREVLAASSSIGQSQQGGGNGGPGRAKR